MGKQVQLPVGPITRSRACKLQGIINLLVQNWVSNMITDEEQRKAQSLAQRWKTRAVCANYLWHMSNEHGDTPMQVDNSHA